MVRHEPVTVCHWELFPKGKHAVGAPGTAVVPCVWGRAGGGRLGLEVQRVGMLPLGQPAGREDGGLRGRWDRSRPSSRLWVSPKTHADPQGRRWCALPVGSLPGPAVRTPRQVPYLSGASSSPIQWPPWPLPLGTPFTRGLQVRQRGGPTHRSSSPSVEAGWAGATPTQGPRAPRAAALR